MRALLQDKTDAASVSLYPTLWGIEFRVRPTTEHQELRRQVAEDLRRLRGLDPDRLKLHANVLVEGYKLTEDTENRQWAEALLAQRSPASGASAAYREWSEKTPFPRP